MTPHELEQRARELVELIGAEAYDAVPITLRYLRAVRDASLEEAAKIAENEPCETGDPLNHAHRIAYALRAAKEAPR